MNILNELIESLDLESDYLNFSSGLPNVIATYQPKGLAVNCLYEMVDFKLNVSLPHPTAIKNANKGA